MGDTLGKSLGNGAFFMVAWIQPAQSTDEEKSSMCIKVCTKVFAAPDR